MTKTTQQQRNRPVVQVEKIDFRRTDVFQVRHVEPKHEEENR